MSRLAFVLAIRSCAPFAVVLVAGAGCSSAASGTLVLDWAFADGRDCATAGAATVEARAHSALTAAPLATFDCASGLAPATVTIAAAPGSGTLFVDARDANGVDLYRGTLSLDDDPPGTGMTRSITLIANAAE